VRAVVTGGAGFIGSHVVDALVARGHDVISLDAIASSAHADRPDYLRDDVDHLDADVRDLEAVREAVGGVDAVCHQAAMVGLGVDFFDVDAYVSHNDLGTATLLRALHERRFRGSIVLASSMVVYGEGRYRCDEHGDVRPGPRRIEDLELGRFEPRCPTCGAALAAEAITEEAPLDPRNVYAATKLHQEHLCAAYAREHGGPVAALRYHNVYGPRMPRDTPYAGVASIFRSALERGDAPTVLEDGRQMRNFVHVRDVADANVRAMESGADGAFNIASATPHTVGEMADALAGAFGARAPRPRVVGGYRLGDVRHVFASPEKAWRELGFRSAVRFEDGMRAFARDPLRAPQTVASRTPVAISPSTRPATARR
jgi:dTDP-L-rhamnose 4-epimerase